MKLRFFTGGLIALHGLIRILFTERYLDFVYDNFLTLLPSDTLLTVGSTIVPFLEFFIGLLIMCIAEKKSPIWAGFILSVIMSIFLILGNLYTYLLYHMVVMILLSLLYVKQIKTKRRKLIL